MDENKDFKTAPETKTIEESQSLLSTVLEQVNTVAPDMGFDAIMTILALPDREFSLMKELVLNELEKSLNNVEDKMMMVQSLNAAGLKADDLNVFFGEIIDQIDNGLKGTLSQSRIDFLKRVIGTIISAVNDTEGIAKRLIYVAYEFCRDGAVQPKYAHAGDAGMDVYAPEEFEVLPGETKIIPIGIKTAIPLGYELQVRPRSGVSVKTKMRVANSPGTIDCNYRDEIGVIIENIEPKIKDLDLEQAFDEDGRPTHMIVRRVEYGRPFMVAKGERFAQLVLNEVPMAFLYKVDNVKEIGQDRAGGFGSSGSK